MGQNSCANRQYVGRNRFWVLCTKKGEPSSRSGGEEVEGLSHDDARHVVDDEVPGTGDDLGAEGVYVVLHAVDELRSH